MSLINGYTKYKAALEYISQNVSSALAIDLQARLVKMIDDLATFMEHEVTTSGAHFLYNGEARRTALCALLLCQRVYLKQLNDKVQRDTFNWPTVTVDHWNWKSENEIKAGIAMYTTQPGGASLADVAALEPDNSVTMQNVVFKLSRNIRPFPVHTTCYRAVQSWLLQAGHVSLPWYEENVIANNLTGAVRNNGDQLLAMFGSGVRRIDVSGDGAIPVIPRNYVVYMYKANSDLTPAVVGVLGHWMVSNGDGTGYGRNNAQTADDRPANSWAHCSILEQIRAVRPTGEAAKKAGLRTCIQLYHPNGIVG